MSPVFAAALLGQGKTASQLVLVALRACLTGGPPAATALLNDLGPVRGFRRRTLDPPAKTSQLFFFNNF